MFKPASEMRSCRTSSAISLNSTRMLRNHLPYKLRPIGIRMRDVTERACRSMAFWIIWTGVISTVFLLDLYPGGRSQVLDSLFDGGIGFLAPECLLQLGPRLLERHLRRHPLRLELDDVVPELRFHEVGHLAGLRKRKRGVFERLHHLPPREGRQESAGLLRLGITRILSGEGGEVSTFPDLVEDLLGLFPDGRLLFRCGLGIHHEKDVTHLRLLVRGK